MLERLAETGLQSDARFAEQFARERVGRGDGPRKIRHALAGRGIDARIADDALAALGDNWAELAASARRKRFGEAQPATFEERARQGRFLEGRGFTAEQARRALGGRGPHED